MKKTIPATEEPPSHQTHSDGFQKPELVMDIVSHNNTDMHVSVLDKLKSRTLKLFSHKERSLEEDVADLMEERDPQRRKVGNEERLLVHNVLSLSDKTVYDVMTPRSDIIAVEYNVSLNDLKQVVLEQEHTRIPVYKETLDHMVGFLHIKDLIPIFASKKKFEIQSIIREVLYVPPSMKGVDLLLKMRARRVHIAIVVDEYGGTEGLLTMEDVVEEIVGEIEDEHDDVSETDYIILDDKTFQVKARMDIRQLEDKLQVRLTSGNEEEDFGTVGGYIFFLLGRIPEKGEIIQHETGLIFEILDADPRRIKKLIIRKPAPQA